MRRKERKNKMEEREKQRIWDPAWGNQMRIQILGDANLIVNWMNGKWKINNQKVKMMVQRHRTRWTGLTSGRWVITWICDSTFTEIGTKKPTDSRMWQEKKGATWNSYIAEAEARIEAVRSFFVGGVSSACTDKIKNRVGSAYVILIAE